MRSDPPVALDDLVLGESDAVLELETAEDHRLVARALAARVGHRLRITSRHLDPEIYDDEAFVDALRSRLLERRRARVEVLVRDPAPILGTGHRLVALAQRLPSFIEIRRLAPEHEGYNSAMLLVDDVAYVDRLLADRYEATARFADPRRARELATAFAELWRPAAADPNLRRLGL